MPNTDPHLVLCFEPSEATNFTTWAILVWTLIDRLKAYKDVPTRLAQSLTGQFGLLAAKYCHLAADCH